MSSELEATIINSDHESEVKLLQIMNYYESEVDYYE